MEKRKERETILERLQVSDKVGMQAIDDPEIVAFCRSKVDAMSKYIGYRANLNLDSVKLIHEYEFALDMTLRYRKLEQRNCGGYGSGALVSSEDVWTAIDADRSGNFEIGVPGSTSEETCHKCGGDSICSKCGGKKQTSCHECHGTKKCRQCGGTGLQKCPNCSGRGTVSRLKPGGNCSWCHGKGEVFESGSWRSCRHCGGKGQAGDVTYSVTCPTCGGDGKITCKLCGGGRVCTACKGVGIEECTDCSGTGKCRECGATGKAKYTWWCTQKQLTFSAIDKWFDAFSASEKDLGALVREIPELCKTEPILSSDSSSHISVWLKHGWSNAFETEFEAEELDETIFPDVYFNRNPLNKSGSAIDVFSHIRQELMKNRRLEIIKQTGNEFKQKIVAQKCVIIKKPLMIKCDVSDCGVQGAIYLDLGRGKMIHKANMEQIELACKQHCNDRMRKDSREASRKHNEEQKRQEEAERKRTRAETESSRSEARREWLKWDLYGAVLLLPALAVVGLPFVLGKSITAEYLSVVFTPSVVTGIAAYLLSGFASAYFYNYVWCQHSFWVYEYHWTPTNWGRSFLRLLWVLVPLVLVQGLCAKVPQMAQFLQPAKEWFAAISSTEWSYIAGVCALKVAIIWASRKWEWKFAVEKGVIVLLAVLALAFAVWPSHLPDGMALKSGMEQALPYVALPVRFLGLAVYWPVWIGLWALGFVGRMAVSLVLWIISLFM